jgi:hypothetical protein
MAWLRVNDLTIVPGSTTEHVVVDAHGWRRQP